jgi:hypothetical protein
MMKISSVNIRPTVGVYATYRRISYTPWNALAEFIDNSTQSYYSHRKELKSALSKEPGGGKLRILTDYDPDTGTLVIRDNANGMDETELERALVLDKPPPDTSGRCEFGMGLKTAACWFGTTWTITTCRLGSGSELRARIHVPDLVERHVEEIPVEQRTVKPTAHYTELTISGLYKPIVGRTLGKIKDQLGSMYRTDLRTGEVEIFWRGEPVTFEDPPIFVEQLESGPYRWWKEVKFSVESHTGKVLPVKGWVALRNPGNQRLAGLALLRRGRVVVGGPGEGYKPEELFGQGNTFRSQRLVGELELDSWPVTQTKDAFDWSGGLEDALIKKLREACHDFIDKAEGLRTSPRQVTPTEMEIASGVTRQVLENPKFAAAIERELELPEPTKSRAQEIADAETLRKQSKGPVLYRLNLKGKKWVFRLHWQDLLSDANWMSVAFPDSESVDIFLNTSHPFISPHVPNPGMLELIQKFVIALALAEKMANQLSVDGKVDASEFRILMNRVLRQVGELEMEGVG